MKDIGWVIIVFGFFSTIQFGLCDDLTKICFDESTLHNILRRAYSEAAFQRLEDLKRHSSSFPHHTVQAVRAAMTELVALGDLVVRPKRIELADEKGIREDNDAVWTSKVGFDLRIMLPFADIIVDFLGEAEARR